MKKTNFFINIVRAFFLFLLLMFVFIKIEDLNLQIILISIFILIGCYVIENFCNLTKKTVVANFFHKLFKIILILFGFEFVFLWCYACIKGNQYLSLIFTIPFCIFEFYIIRRYLLGINSKVKYNNKKNKFDYNKFISVIIFFVFFVSGIVSLSIGVKNIYSLSKKTKNYLTTIGYFESYEIYSINKVGDYLIRGKPTYSLTYVYKVDGIEYFIKTDYGVGTIPDKNSARKIKYNPENPSDAVFLESDKNSVFILLGLIFTLFSMPFVFKTLNKNVFFRKLKNDILGLYMGVVFFVLGIGVINFLLSQASSFIEVIKNWGFWIVIPIVFIVAGFLQIIKCLFMIIKKNKK